MFLIVASKKDEASMNIARKIREIQYFEILSERFQEDPIYYKKIGDHEVKLVFIGEDAINAHSITDFFNPEIIVFVSRHSSLSGIPTWSVHTPGNLANEAKYGGLPRKVSVSPASMMKNTLKEMAKIREETALNYNVSYECTHHGPSLDAPTMFVELGSTPKQWVDLEAAEGIARALINALCNDMTYPAAIGIGGPHYNEKFTEIALNTPVAFGHMIPKYAVPSVDASMVEQCVERTKEKVQFAVFDWKGVQGSDRSRLISAVTGMHLAIKRT